MPEQTAKEKYRFPNKHVGDPKLDNRLPINQRRIAEADIDWRQIAVKAVQQNPDG
jgi:hypothetical protein